MRNKECFDDQLDENMDVIPSEETIAPLRVRYLGDQDEVGARISGAQNQTSKREVECRWAQFQMFNQYCSI